MKNFLECLIIAALFFIATTALLTVDDRAGRMCTTQVADTTAVDAVRTVHKLW